VPEERPEVKEVCKNISRRNSLRWVQETNQPGFYVLTQKAHHGSRTACIHSLNLGSLRKQVGPRSGIHTRRIHLTDYLSLGSYLHEPAANFCEGGFIRRYRRQSPRIHPEGLLAQCENKTIHHITVKLAGVCLAHQHISRLLCRS